MADIFLSYARADQHRIEKLATALEEAGYSVWWDRHIKGGSEFSKDIEEAIAASKAVIVVWSAHSAESEWVREEASYARDHHKLVPVRIDDTPPPFGYRQRQAIDLNAPEGDEQLRAALDALVGSEHAPIDAAAPPQKRKFSPLLLILPVLLLISAVGWYVMSQGSDSQEIALEDKRGIMVLPFLAQSSGEDDQYFADGLTEEILNRLDALDELRVVPRTTAFTYRETDQPLNAIAEEVRVGHIVEGTLRRAGDQVRITARLVEADGEQTLWSENYDATVEDVFKVQADIAEKVAASLDVLLDDDKLAAMQGAGIDNPEAFAIYAKGNDFFTKGHANLSDLTVFASSVPLFDQAFAKEPRLAQSQINAADFFSHIVMDEAGGMERRELPEETRNNALEQLRSRLERARAAEPEAGPSLAVDLFRLAFTDDWSTIPDRSRRFYAMEDNCASSAWPGFGYTVYGHGGEVLNHYERRFTCGAMDVNFWNYLSTTALLAGELDRLEAVIERASALPIDQRPIERGRFWLYLGRGDFDKASQMVERLDATGWRYLLAAARGDRAGLPALDWIMARPPYKAMQWLPIIGEQQRADDWAARIDAAPAGPTVLQIVVDECLCGAPFDIARTPNFAKRVEELGASWPPKSPINWPLKKL